MTPRTLLQRLQSSVSRRVIASLLCLVLTTVFFYNWVAVQPYNDGTWKRVQNTSILRVGMDVSYPPFSHMENGTPIGLDVDIVNEVGRRLGVRVEIVNMSYDSLYDELKIGTVDTLFSALSVDPTKVGNFLYTYRYIDAGQVIGSLGGQFNTMNDLDGHSVAVEQGSVADETVHIWQRRLHEIKVQRFVEAKDAIAAVNKKTADAVIVDYITARLHLYQVNSHQLTGEQMGVGQANQPIDKPANLVFSKNYITNDPYCGVVRIASYDLGGAISHALGEMEQDGTLATLTAKWLGPIE